MLHFAGVTGAHFLAVLAVVFVAGLAAICCQVALGPAIHETLWVGSRLSETLRAAALAFGAVLATITLGALTAALIAPLGIWALMGLSGGVALLVLIPGHARAQSVRELAQPAATRLYALQLGRCVGLSGAERREMTWVIKLVEHLRSSGLLEEVEQNQVLDARTLKLVLQRYGGAYAAWTVSEHWDGSGPTGLDSSAIPRMASIMALAEHWAKLTGLGGPELSHEQALTLLRTGAGTRHDPTIVQAAEQIVERERRFRDEDVEAAFQPGARRALPALGSAMHNRLLALIAD